MSFGTSKEEMSKMLRKEKLEADTTFTKTITPEILELLDASKFDFHTPYNPPSESALQIWSGSKPCFALDFGQVGTLTGHEGTRKSTLLAVLIAAGLSGKEILNITLDLRGKKILLIDTEQSKSRFGWLLKENLKHAGIEDNHPQLIAYTVSAFESPEQKLMIMRYLLEHIEDVGVCIVDGSAQMVSNVNSEEENIKLMTIYKALAINHNVMIFQVVHLTKEGTYPTGWLGTFSKNMSELVMRLVLDKDQEKDTPDTIVSADKVRGHWRFTPFRFNQDDTGKPILTDKLGNHIRPEIYVVSSPNAEEINSPF